MMTASPTSAATISSSAEQVRREDPQQPEAATADFTAPQGKHIPYWLIRISDNAVANYSARVREHESARRTVEEIRGFLYDGRWSHELPAWYSRHNPRVPNRHSLYLEATPGVLLIAVPDRFNPGQGRYVLVTCIAQGTHATAGDKRPSRIKASAARAAQRRDAYSSSRSNRRLPRLLPGDEPQISDDWQLA